MIEVQLTRAQVEVLRGLIQNPDALLVVVDPELKALILQKAPDRAQEVDAETHVHLQNIFAALEEACPGPRRGLSRLSQVEALPEVPY